MSGKIRVLQAIRQGKIGGGESHVLNLVNFLDKEQFEPIVLSFTPGPMVDKLRASGITTHVIPGKSPINVQMWRQVKSLLEEEQIDLIHVHGTRANMNIVWAAKQCKIPIVYTVHGWSFHPDQSFLIRNARITAERMLTRWADLTITVSNSNHKTGQQLIKGFQSKIIFYGIDTQRFQREQDFTDVRTPYGIPADHTLVLFLARMTLQKDPITMIQAFKVIADRHKDITLLLIGQGELDQDVAAAIEQNGLQDRVVRDGFRLDVPDVLNASDIYCLPSLWEGQPIGLIEAMAIGKAVIATHVDGSKELVKDGVNGLLIDPQQPQQLAEAIERLHVNSKLRKKLADQAYLTIKERYDGASMARQIEDAYLSILKREYSYS
ncbi:glycosyltransferase family 4 protein [Spirosoma validum]|uniref:Glycosyltransferase family 4 protein n=1 Tax=Spirosoma validum TaxID=2771355 RepID=A0A927GG10_9BACT|nr:glycosyltransferase family 4 protein [Spirosoma validum]MBD2756218.1 glycosyltransferase family 4 protein [Spirosoma validum]